MNTYEDIIMAITEDNETINKIRDKIMNSLYINLDNNTLEDIDMLAEEIYIDFIYNKERY